jgi:N-acetylglutamate synthase-like GNAT family acetyltransferase
MEIQILDYAPHYQSQIDAMMVEIQSEFQEAITSVHSTIISQVYQDADQKFWIALSDDTVAGTIGIKFFSEGKAEIKRMMVSPKFRGKIHGTATLLMNQALAFANEKQVRDIYLGTMQQFVAAQKFYERIGFQPIEIDKLPMDYKINPMDTLFYKMELA